MPGGRLDHVHHGFDVLIVSWQVDYPREVVIGEDEFLRFLQFLGNLFVDAGILYRDLIDEARRVQAREGAVLLEELADSEGAPVGVRGADDEIRFGGSSLECAISGPCVLPQRCPCSCERELSSHS